MAMLRHGGDAEMTLVTGYADSFVAGVIDVDDHPAHEGTDISVIDPDASLLKPDEVVARRSLLLSPVEYSVYVATLLSITIAACLVTIFFACPGEGELLPTFDAILVILSAAAGLFYADFARRSVSSAYQHMAGMYFLSNAMAGTGHAAMHETFCRNAPLTHLITMCLFVIGTFVSYLLLQCMTVLKVEALGAVGHHGRFAPRAWRWPVGLTGGFWGVVVITDSTLHSMGQLETLSGLLFVAAWCGFTGAIVAGFWIASKPEGDSGIRDATAIPRATIARDSDRSLVLQACCTVLANGMTALMVLAALYENSSYKGELSMHTFLYLNMSSGLANTLCAAVLSGVLCPGKQRDVHDPNAEEDLHDLLVPREDSLTQIEFGEALGSWQRLRTLLASDVSM